ncbi:MAG: hypothetical protein AAF639_13075 [Chloroflexota bacterium]
MTDKFEQLKSHLQRLFHSANQIVENNQEERLLRLYPDEVSKATELAKLKHAFRGAAITLLAYKLVDWEQDIRAHKDEYDGGFSARSFDTKITVPFLIEQSLPRNVETHWLTQTLSFAPTLTSNVNLKTVPKKSGPLLVEVVNLAQKASSQDIIEAMVTVIFVELIKIRNKEKVILTKPKNLPIYVVTNLLKRHFAHSYKSNAPRLPQIAIYAIYQAILPQNKRFDGQELQPLQRLKSADRKAGTVGDVVVVQGQKPVEAVEIKFDQPISYIHVCEAIEKVRAESVRRYYLLSTKGIAIEDEADINDIKTRFLKQNGCEIIVNGVIETIGYYLRLLPDTTEFLFNYASLVEMDPDTSYEHRIAWNEDCTQI